MKKFLLIFLFPLFLLLSWTRPSRSVNQQVDAFLTRTMKEMDIPGLAIAVVHNGTLVHLNGYGMANLEWKLPTTPHTTFQIASCSKLLASTVVIKALYTHKLSLEDGIEKYVDSIPASWKGLKVKHLITHSSGLRNFSGDLYASTAQVVQSLKDSTLEYPIGTRQSYVSADYVVLRYVLEQVYGKPYEQILKDEVTSVAGMQDGGFDMEERVGAWMQTRQIAQKSATYYGKGQDKIVYKYLYPQYTYTAGGYFASAADMAKWAMALDRETFFNRATLEQYAYQSDSIGGKRSGFGRVGWVVERQNGILYAGHSGGPGLGDIIRFPQEGYTFIVLSNDGELYPGLAMMVASYYIKGLKPEMKVQKFVRH